ncbi:MAG: phosphotransferase, partial [Chloroflexota bacterium]|nr:phosphotransferase [Chloroflexota bacterium]
READLDIERPGELAAWLRAAGYIPADEEPAVTVLAGGVSNRTVLVERPSGEAWVVKQALAKLRVAVDWFSSPERIHREADGLRWLGRFAPEGSITPLVFEDHAHHLLGMAAVPQPHENWKVMLLRGDLREDHVRQFAALIGAVHRESNRHLSELMPVFGDRNFYETLRVEPYYRYTAGQISESAAFYERLIADTYARQDTIVHGDFSPKNVLVHEGRLILLDHEVIHLGDPCFDLGFGLTHLLSKAHHLPAHRDAFAQAAVRFWDTYWSRVAGSGDWTDGLEERAVRHTLGCLLARVRGRSPLEYMDETERARQAEVVSTLMADPPATVKDLAAQFTAAITFRENNA